MPSISDVLLAIATSPWSYVFLAVLLIVDGFFPFVPGETAVGAFAAVSASRYGPEIWLVLSVAVAATMVGDAVAFAIGRRLGVSRWRWMRRPRFAASFAWAARGLHHRPGVFFVIAKFVPFARVAVTMTAGASNLPVARYLPISLLASVIYTTYHVGVGLAAGTWFGTNPLLAVAVAIGSIVVAGLIAEGVKRAVRRRVP